MSRALRRPPTILAPSPGPVLERPAGGSSPGGELRNLVTDLVRGDDAEIGSLVRPVWR
jgi:hypothetical protein